MERRTFLGVVPASLLLLATRAESREGIAQPVAVSRSERKRWKAILPPERYRILFDATTEKAGSSTLNAEQRAGTYICAACHSPLFSSKAKYESGTGWPSFFDVLPRAVAERSDYMIIIPRTEYHCARCGGHQGHVFDDGPAPTGKRYCNNGLALEFVAVGAALPPIRLV